MRTRTARFLVSTALGSVLACSAPPSGKPATPPGSAAERLKHLTSPLPPDFVERRVYVSVYSSIYLGLENEPLMVNLAATVSVRNVSADHALILTHARYFDSAGKAVRDYVQAPGELGPMATVEFVVKRDDTAGGPGANFVLEWAGPPDMDEPIVEAVMIGQSGHAGFSFISRGESIRRPASAVAPSNTGPRPAARPTPPPAPSARPKPAPPQARKSPAQKQPAAKPQAQKNPTQKPPTPKPTGDRNNVRRPARPSPTPQVPARKGDPRKG